ncbi:hypothetical protein TIFTF001_024141 [Ficus carica]|uniref:Uncharacterized protein n=1 Tax=Ficus carica TaxID=3494 RepID=A0AA88API7_FICCA|nr:hypothetical protein TIFTF001_024141 [Ficus carica]
MLEPRWPPPPLLPLEPRCTPPFPQSQIWSAFEGGVGVWGGKDSLASSPALGCRSLIG